MAESVAGLCSEKQEFRRLILRYAPNGQATSLTKELYKPCGSFDYEKRASTSIRRSMDTRRPNAQARSSAHPASHGSQLGCRRCCSHSELDFFFVLPSEVGGCGKAEATE